MLDRSVDALGATAPGGLAQLKELALLKRRDDIIGCSLEPGALISEAQLANRYGLGKAAIRAGLQHLETLERQYRHLVHFVMRTAIDLGASSQRREDGAAATGSAGRGAQEQASEGGVER